MFILFIRTIYETYDTTHNFKTMFVSKNTVAYSWNGQGPIQCNPTKWEISASISKTCSFPQIHFIRHQTLNGRCSYNRTHFNRSHGQPIQNIPCWSQRVPLVLRWKWIPSAQIPGQISAKFYPQIKNIKIHSKKLTDFFSQPPFTFYLLNTIKEHQLYKMHLCRTNNYTKQQFPLYNFHSHINCMIIASSFIRLFQRWRFLLERETSITKHLNQSSVNSRRQIVFSKGQFYFYLFCFILFK